MISPLSPPEATPAVSSAPLSPPPKLSQTIAGGLGTLGLLLAFVSVSFGLVLPLLWPPSLLWPLYTRFVPSLLLLALLSPFLLFCGLAWKASASPSLLWRSFKATLGAELFLGGMGLLFVDIIKLVQIGWLHLPLSSALLGTLPGFFFAPPMLAFGLALLLRPSFRDHLGILLTALSWQALLLFGLALLYLQIIPQLTPLSKKLPPPEAIRTMGLWIAAFVLVASALGTFLMARDIRFRLHLIFLSPLWLPLFVLLFFWSLVINTTIYFLNDLFGLSLQPSRPAKILLLSLPSLLLFPLLLLIDFSKGLTYQMGRLLLLRLFPPGDEATSPASPSNPATSAAPDLSPSPLWCYSLGILALFTLPLWLLPAIVFLSVKVFVYDAILMQIRQRS